MRIDIPDETMAFERHLRARHRSPETVKTYHRGIHQLEEYLLAHGRDPGDAEIDKTTLESMFADAVGTLSRVTLAQRFRSLQQFFKYVAEESEQPNPMAGMHSISAPVTPPPVLTPDELTRLFATAKGKGFEDRRDLAILSLFADTGVRRSEMAGIRLADLDRPENAVVVTGKTGTRGVQYGDETATRIDRYIRVRKDHPAHASEWLWLGRKGRLTVFGVETVVERRGRQAGIKVHPHLFRHTFAHLWLDNGGSEIDLQKLAGWRSPLMLQRYGASAASARAIKNYRAGRSPVDKITNRT